MRNWKRPLGLLLLLAMALAMLAGCGGERQHEKTAVTRFEQLSEPGRKIGVGIGTGDDIAVRAAFPEAQVELFNDGLMGYAAVADGSLDAFCFSKRNMELAIRNGRTGVRLLEETVGEGSRVAVGLSPNSHIPDLKRKIDAFIAEAQADGTLDDMYERWAVNYDETMPDIAVPEHAETRLRVGTIGIVPPFSYYVGTELTGYDIELARRFAARLGAELELKVYDYTGLIAAAQSGDVDCIMAELYVTPEREEAIPFSEPLFTVALGVMVRDEGAAAQTQTGAAAAEASEVRWQDYNGKRLGVLVGPLMEDAAAEFFPDSEYLLFNSYPDCATALLAGRIDGFLGDEPGMISMHAENPAIDYIHESLTENNYAFAFRKDDPESAALCAELNEFLAKSWADGTMHELEDIWLGVDEARKVVDMSGLTGENGKIRVVTTSTDMPWSYIKDGKNVGYDIDLVVRFCRARGYALELGDVDFAGRIPAVQSGKYDFSTDMNVTPERREQVIFSDPTSHGGIVLAVRASDLAAKRTSAAGTGGQKTLADMAHARIGVQTGTTHDELVAAQLPDAKIQYYNTYADLLAALSDGKIDAFPISELTLRPMLAEAPQLRTVPGAELMTADMGFVAGKTPEGQALCDEFSAWFAEIRASGEMEELLQKWTEAPDSERTVLDWTALPAERGTLHMATEGGFPPYEYYLDGHLVGIEIDLVARFCKEKGYGLEITDMSFESVLPSVSAGKSDFAAAGIAITAVREESLSFTEPYLTERVVLVTLSKDAAMQAGGYTSADDLRGKTIACTTGSITAEYVRDYFNGDVNVMFFDSHTDMVLALNSGKIDAYCTDSVAAEIQSKSSNGATRALSPPIHTTPVGFIFQKGSEQSKTIRAQFNEYLSGLGREQLSALQEYWLGDDEEIDVIDMSFTGENGHLKMAVATGFGKPWCYVKDGAIAGFEMQLAADFCREYGYSLEFVDYDFQGMLAAVQTGKCDMAGCAILRTPERMEQMDYSEPTADNVFVLVVSSSGASEPETLFDRIYDSFEKTFIRESRWKLFVQGIGTTLLITVLSIILGTALGFGVYLLCRSGNPIANGVTRFFVWLIHGMPMVVLLMILYYIIFGKVAISGTIVAVIGFTLVFGASVFGMLRSGVGAVEKGQMEAAYALGYTDNRAFFRVILPQALPHFFPAYKGEITATIKATAIVGYVAVQDLTKMGDIVRSRTYEAFFPLIAVAVIYFILAGILTAIVNRLGVFIDPRRRKKEDVLKGVTVK